MSEGGHGGHAVMGGEPPMTGHHGHDASAGHGDHATDFRRRFWLSLVLTVPVVTCSDLLRRLTGWTPPGFPAPISSGRCSAPPCSLRRAGLPRRRLGGGTEPAPGDDAAHLDGPAGGLRRLGRHRPGPPQRLPVARALHPWSPSCCSATGWRCDPSARPRIPRALAALLPDEAERLDPNGELETVPVSRAGPRRHRARPARGPRASRWEIVDGAAEVDESMVTGESAPVAKGPGDRGGGDRLDGTPPSGSGFRLSARTRRWRASSGWSPRRRPPDLGPRRWPTALPPCCSMWRRRRER